jgi:hypothetical protein
MKSTDVYAAIKEVIAPWTIANGFKRTKTLLGWSRPHGSRFLVFWFQCSRDGWDSHAGSKFIAEFQFDSTSEPGGAGLRHRLPHFLAPPQLEEARQLQNRVISKLEKPAPDHPLVRDPGLRAWYLAKFEPLAAAPSSRTDFWLRYGDEDDVRHWARFIKTALPEIFGKLAPDLTLKAE